MNRPLRVVGLDLSLASTGMSDGQSAHAIQTTADTPVEARLDALVVGVTSFVRSPTQWTDKHPYGTWADLVVIEGPAFSRHGPGHEELAALRLMVRHRLWRLEVPFAVVTPTTLKKYVTGSGTATKQDMVSAVHDRYGVDLIGVKVKDGRYDRADAYCLAALGYDHVGQPLGEAAHRASLDAVEWPDLLSD